MRRRTRRTKGEEGQPAQQAQPDEEDEEGDKRGVDRRCIKMLKCAPCCGLHVHDSATIFPRNISRKSGATIDFTVKCPAGKNHTYCGFCYEQFTTYKECVNHVQQCVFSCIRSCDHKMRTPVCRTLLFKLNNTYQAQVLRMMLE